MLAGFIPYNSTSDEMNFQLYVCQIHAEFQLVKQEYNELFLPNIYIPKQFDGLPLRPCISCTIFMERVHRAGN